VQERIHRIIKKIDCSIFLIREGSEAIAGDIRYWQG